MSLDARALHDQLLAEKPEGARHDTDICVFCVDKATQIDDSTASDPSGSEPSGAPTNPSTEGGINSEMADNDTITRETHEALIAKALADGTAALEAALAAKSEEVAALTTQVNDLTAEKATLTEDNKRLNSDLDKAQIDIKAAQDEVAALKDEASKKDEAARLAEVEKARIEQVENLNLFEKDYVSKKSSEWASLDDTAWAERLEEWKTIKPTPGGDGSDAASSLSGSGGLTDEASGHKSAKREALGLD